MDNLKEAIDPFYIKVHPNQRCYVVKQKQVPETESSKWLSVKLVPNELWAVSITLLWVRHCHTCMIAKDMRWAWCFYHCFILFQAGSPFHEPLFKLLVKFTEQTVDLFLSEKFLGDAHFTRVFLSELRLPERGEKFRAVLLQNPARITNLMLGQITVRFYI